MGNLIDWSSLEVRNFEKKEGEFNLSELIEKVAEKYKNQFEKKQIRLKIEIEPTISVNADQAMIRKSIENLLTNSLKFTLKGGNVTISTKKESGKASFSLTDSGIGMSSAKIANIFNPSRKATQKGTANELGLGMGLIVAKAYLQLHNSELSIESEQGKGTTIGFELEMVEE
jgi:signal transduction histidine kinase